MKTETELHNDFKVTLGERVEDCAYFVIYFFMILIFCMKKIGKHKEF